MKDLRNFIHIETGGVTKNVPAHEKRGSRQGFSNM